MTRFLALLLIFFRVLNASIQFVANDGTFKTASQLNNFLKSKESQITDSNVPVLNVIDCTSSASGYSICNKILSSSFEFSSPGVYLDVTKSSIVLCSSFDSIFGAKYCGALVADFFRSLDKSNSVVIVSEDEIDEALLGYDQVFKRLRSNNAQKFELSFIIVSQSKLNESEMNKISEKIQQYSSTEDIPIRLFYFDISTASLNESVDELLSESAVEYLELGKLLEAAWKSSLSTPLRPILSDTEKRSLIEIESAYTAGMIFIEGITSEWLSRVGSGKLIHKFGSRVQSLLDSVKVKFTERTVGSSLSLDRAERAKSLHERIEAVTNVLYRQQLQILKVQTANNFKKELRKLAASEQPSTSELEQQLLRKAIFDFQLKAVDLDVQSLEISSESHYSDILKQLEDILIEFPESSASKLEAIKKFDRKVKKPSKKNGRAVNVALSFVGMLRPPGYGNLQGYATYAAAFAGIPVDFIVGIQNDGESPEVVGEDREYPVFRVQPKLNFDIDL